MAKPNRVRQRWHVLIKGEKSLRTATILDETDETISLMDQPHGKRVRMERFRTRDIEFVERDDRRA